MPGDAPGAQTQDPQGQPGPNTNQPAPNVALTPGAAPATDAGGEGSQVFSADYVKTLRTEAAGYRTQLRDAEAKLTKLEQAEADRKKKELEAQGQYQELAKVAQAEKVAAEARAKELEEQVEAERNQRAKDRLVLAVAAQAGAFDPDDPNIALATKDAAATPEAVKQAVEALKKAKPYLFRAATQPFQDFNPQGGGGPSETDAQRIARLRQKTGQMVSPLT
jgi:hypothetical protein